MFKFLTVFVFLLLTHFQFSNLYCSLFCIVPISFCVQSLWPRNKEIKKKAAATAVVVVIISSSIAMNWIYDSGNLVRIKYLVVHILTPSKEASCSNIMNTLYQNVAGVAV